MICFLKFIPAILHGDLTTSCSPVGGEFDFSKSQIPTISPTMPGRGEVGDNIDRCISAKRMVYQATVLAVLSYGAETWTLEADNVRYLTVFHICVRTILYISRYEQWQQHLTSATLLDTFGIEPIFLK